MASSVTAYHPHSEEEWQAIKPIFLKLYIDEGKTLEDVRAVLSELYEFSASKKAFKSHITRWEAFKNYKASEKEMLAQRKEPIHGAEHGTLPLRFRDRPIKWDRVERYSKARIAQRRRQASVHPSFVAAEELRRSTPLVISRSLPDRDEMVLRAGEDYYKWTYASWLRSDGPMRASSVFEISGDVVDALTLISMPLKKRQRQGWSLLDKICQNIRKDLESNSLAVLMAMIKFAIRSDILHFHSALVHQLFDYTCSLALLVLSSDHRFKKLLRYLDGLASLRRIAMPMLLLSSDTLPNSVKMTPQGDWFAIQFQVGVELTNNHRYEESKTFMGLIESAVLTDQNRLVLKNQAAYIELSLGNYETAILQLTQIVQTVKPTFTKSHQSVLLTCSYGSLAYCHEIQGNMAAALDALKLAVNHGMFCYGQQDAVTIQLLGEYTRKLKHAKRWKELASLQRQYAFFFADEASSPESEVNGRTPGVDAQIVMSQG